MVESKMAASMEHQQAGADDVTLYETEDDFYQDVDLLQAMQYLVNNFKGVLLKQCFKGFNVLEMLYLIFRYYC